MGGWEREWLTVVGGGLDFFEGDGAVAEDGVYGCLAAGC